MLERKYWRAIYDAERKSFVVEDAGWIDGDPAIEYCFTFFGGDETGHQIGGLEKCWLTGWGFQNTPSTCCGETRIRN